MGLGWATSLLVVLCAQEPPAEPQQPVGAEDHECTCPVGDFDGVQEVTPSPSGGLAPRERSSIRLREVALQIGVHEQKGMPADLKSMTKYVLWNPGPERSLKVGFQFTWTSHRDPPPGALPEERILTMSAAKLSGHAFECEAIEGVTSEGRLASAWCTKRILVPPGESVWPFEGGATLARETDLNYAWALRRPFSAEAAWGEAPVRLTIALDVAMLFGPLVVVQPPGATIEATHAGKVLEPKRLRWTLDHPDLGSVGGLFAYYADQAAYDPGWGRRPDEVASRGVTVAASSTLHPQGRFRYEPGLAADGDRATGWCEAKAGNGEGEWLEVRPNIEPAMASRCWLTGFRVVPGFGYSNAAWQRNGRVRRFRISTCERPSAGFEVDLATVSNPAGKVLPEEPRNGTLHVPPSWPGPRPLLPPHATGRECYRLTILEVLPGKDDDTCVSEFLPIFSCTPPGERR